MAIRVARIGPALALALGVTGCTVPSETDGSVDEVTQAVLAPAGSEATVVTAGIPTDMFPGERRFASVTMRNTGAASPANDWTTAYRLLALNSGFAWPGTFVPATVPVGAEHTFAFVITAPPSSQVFSARMMSTGAFGETLNVPVNVSATVVPQWGCTLVSSTLPSSLGPGENRRISVTVQNTGTETWPAQNMKLASRDNPANLWGATNADLTTAVAPGETATFDFNLKAPSSPGTYSFLRDMKNYAGIGDFRRWGFCVAQDVVVGGTPPRDAVVTSTNIPPVLDTNEFSTLTITLRNTGTETWTAGGEFGLYSVSSPVNLWGPTSATLPTETPAGASVTFNIPVKAPATAGDYRTAWRMRKLTGTGAGYFGATIDVPVAVTVPTGLPCRVTSSFPSGQYKLALRMEHSTASAGTGPNYDGQCFSRSATAVLNITSNGQGAYGFFLTPNRESRALDMAPRDDGDTLRLAATTRYAIIGDPDVGTARVSIDIDKRTGIVKAFSFDDHRDDLLDVGRYETYVAISGTGYLTCAGDATTSPPSIVPAPAPVPVSPWNLCLSRPLAPAGCYNRVLGNGGSTPPCICRFGGPPTSCASFMFGSTFGMEAICC